MKKTVHITLILLIGQIYLFAQIKMDTIDYSAIAETNVYRINKITEGSSNQIMRVKPYNGTTMFMIDQSKTKQMLPMFINKKISIHEGDTIIYMEFDLENKITPYFTHQYGVIHINSKSNVLIVDKISFVNQKCLRRQFKIYKLTKSEIIIKDISNQKLNRTYYLLRQ